MNRREIFLISITIFLTVLAWVVYDILQVNYKEFNSQNFQNILQAKSAFSKKIIEVIKEKQP
jgi:predicted negative regulator of RcsB-dependent stress response